ncbi:hypothetical protein GCM10027299_44420 [Larkinella ripae]
MNEDTWLAVLQALPTPIDTPLILFDNPIQAQAWVQLNESEEDTLWIVTNDERKYWVVTVEIGMELLRAGFKQITAIPPLVPPQS